MQEQMKERDEMCDEVKGREDEVKEQARKHPVTSYSRTPF